MPNDTVWARKMRAGNDADRIDGWKAIGRHFGRDRTTVIRWARERGLPVHRIPGGPSGSVYALRGELDAWSRGLPADGGNDSGDGGGDGAPVALLSPAAAEPATPARRWGRWALAAGGSALLIAAFGIGTAPRAPPLPADPAMARVYLDARDAWGARTPAAIDRAIAGLEQVTRAEPGFAPAHAALADAYLLAREFGSVADAVAFARAKKAAEAALTRDPELAAAHRARGFIAYWWERDPAAAGRAFRQALQRDADDAQTRFWYGNILADNGEAAAAERELDAARLREPGSLAIQTDRAWALWSAGRGAEAEAQLRAIIAAHPDFAAAHDALGVIRLEQGDHAGYLDGLRARYRIRRAAWLAERTAALEAAERVGGTPEMARRLVALARAEEQTYPFPDHSWAAFTASVAGDRAQLIEILTLAQRNGERWGAAGFRRAIAARWPGDAAVQAPLARLAAPRIEPGAPAG